MKSALIVICLFLFFQGTGQYVYWNKMDVDSTAPYGSKGFKIMPLQNELYTLSLWFENYNTMVKINKLDSLGNSETSCVSVPILSNVAGAPGDGKYAIMYFGDSLMLYTGVGGIDGTVGFAYLPYFFMMKGCDTLWSELDSSWFTNTSPQRLSPWGSIPWSDTSFVTLCQYDTTWSSDEGLRLIHKDWRGNTLSDNHYTFPGFEPGMYKHGMLKYTEDTLLFWGGMEDPAPGPGRGTFVAKMPLTCDTVIYQFFSDGFLQSTLGGCSAVLAGEDSLFILYPICNQLLSGSSGIYSLKTRMIRISDMHVWSDQNISSSPFDQTPSWGGANLLDIIATSDHGYLVSMYFTSTFNISDVSAIIKIDSNLTTEWITEYQPPLITSFYTSSRLNSLAEAPDGGYYAYGSAWLYNDQISRDWNLKIDACGYLQPSGCPAVVGVDDKLSQEPAMQLWPNPTTGMAHAILPTSTNRINVRDILGRVVYTEPVYYPRQDWNFDFLSPGNYLLEAMQDNGVAVATRLVVQAK